MLTFVRTVIREEPVIVNALLAVGALAATFGLPIDGWIEAAVNGLGSFIAVASVLAARQRVRPLAKDS